MLKNLILAIEFVVIVLLIVYSEPLNSEDNSEKEITKVIKKEKIVETDFDLIHNTIPYYELKIKPKKVVKKIKKKIKKEKIFKKKNKKTYYKHRGKINKKHSKIIKAVYKYSRHFSLDPVMVLAIIQTESAFKWWVGRPGDGKGLMQLLPVTYKKMTGKPIKTIYDVENNIYAGCKYLHSLKKKLKHKDFVIMAYNSGPYRNNGKLKSSWDHFPKTTKYNYITKVKKNMKKFQ